jgi:hypothetical protein
MRDGLCAKPGYDPKCNVSVTEVDEDGARHV